MKKLSQILESINEVDSLLEIDFKDKKAFQKYNAKHKMRPTTKVNIAGKDTTVGDETGKKSKGDETGKKSKGKKDAPVNPDVKIDRDDFEGAFDRAMDGQNYQDAEEFLDIVSNMENQGKFDNLSKDEKLKLEDSMWDLEVGGAELDDDRAIAIRDFFFELQKNHNLFDEPKSDEPKKSPEEVSKESVQTAKDLDNSEQITNDPTGTLEKMDELLSDVMVELEDNEDADDEYFKIDDEFRYRIHQIENEFEDGEDKEQATKDLKDLASDVERFMDNDYRKVAGISKPTKFF